MLVSACNSIGIKTNVNRVQCRLDMRPYNRDSYIYVHATKSGDIFYVGKGMHIRAFVTCGRSKHWHNKVNKNGLEVFILFSGLSEVETLSHEVKIIAECKRLGFNLVNISEGGDGSPAFTVSEETRKKQSQIKKNAPRNPKFIAAGRTARLGMKNKPENIEKTAQARRRKVINSRGEIFNSATEAAKVYGTSQGNISSCARGEKPLTKGLTWSYDITRIPDLIEVQCGKKIMRSDGKVYKSAAEAQYHLSIELGRKCVHQSITESARSSGRLKSYGYTFRYV